MNQRDIVPRNDNMNQRDIVPRNDKDKEISELRNRINTMERERQHSQPKEQVTSYYSRENVTENHQKNELEAQSKKGPGENDLVEMKTFLKGVLDTISAFDRRLTAQMDSSPTRSDK